MRMKANVAATAAAGILATFGLSACVQTDYGTDPSGNYLLCEAAHNRSQAVYTTDGPGQNEGDDEYRLLGNSVFGATFKPTVQGPAEWKGCGNTLTGPNGFDPAYPADPLAVIEAADNDAWHLNLSAGALQASLAVIDADPCNGGVWGAEGLLTLNNPKIPPPPAPAQSPASPTSAASGCNLDPGVPQSGMWRISSYRSELFPDQSFRFHSEVIPFLPTGTVGALLGWPYDPVEGKWVGMGEDEGSPDLIGTVLPGMAMETTALSCCGDVPGSAFFQGNIVAVSPARKACADIGLGYGVYVGTLGRTIEGRLTHETQSFPHATVASFFAEEPVTVRSGDVTITLQGTLAANGRMEGHVLAIEIQGARFEPQGGLRVDFGTGLREWALYVNEQPAQYARFFRWLSETQVGTINPIHVGGTIEELGVEIPETLIKLNPRYFSTWATRLEERGLAGKSAELLPGSTGGRAR